MSNKKEKISKLLGNQKENLIKLEKFKKGQGSRINDFEEVYQKIKSIDEQQADILIPANSLETIIKNKNNIALQESNGGDSLLFSEWSLNQLCVRYNIPKRYIKNCLYENAPDLAQYNLNYWLDKENSDDNILLRYDTKEKRLHGFLSEKYGIFDDIEVFDIVDNTFDSDDYRVQSYAVGPEYTNIRIIHQDKFYDDLSIGFNIRNSRVGRSSLYFEIIIYKWACSNGMIFGGGTATAYKKRHVNVEKVKVIEEVKEIVAELPSLIEYFKEKITSAQTNNLDDESIEKMLENFKNSQRISDKKLNETKEIMKTYGNTRWGFINGLTEIAQEYDLEQRLRIERYAANLLKKTA